MTISVQHNKHFVNIGKSLSDQIQSVTTSEDYLLEHYLVVMTAMSM